MVDNFGIKYVDKQSADHLIQPLQKLYTISINWSANLFCGLTLTWDYTRCTWNVSMPSYIPEALHKFQHLASARYQDAPHSWNRPIFGYRVQYTETDDPSTHLHPKSINLFQQIISTMLYYSITVDPTMLVALGSLDSHQTQATKNTYLRALCLLG